MSPPSARRLLTACCVAACLVAPIIATHSSHGARAAANDTEPRCRKTTVAILGAGVAGITAAQALSNASVTDFLIVERNDYIGGRVRHADFGTNGSAYTVELGANWVQGLGSPGGPENPIWTLARKHGLANTYSNYSSILGYDAAGDGAAWDVEAVGAAYYEAYGRAERDAGRMLTGNEQDTSMRAGLSLGGWKKKQPGRDVYDDARRQAFEWWDWDFETAWSPEQCGFVFGITGYNLTFYQFSEENNFVWDQRGFNTLVVGEAREFLDGDGDGGVIDDERLMLETVVESIAYGPEGVLVGLEGGGCIEAEYAIATFSLGVWQHDAVAVEPAFPRWKRQAIEQFQMGTYTKIFLQFAFDGPPFWDADTEYFLWADPATRGYYPVFQSLTAPGFLAGSGIIFVTVVDDQAYRVERQTDDQTRDEVMQVLRRMFPDKDIPDPVAFMYPRWSTDPMSYGSYSNWPVGMTLEKHQNLRANLDRLWFAGEHTSAQYYGFLHGAWFEGRDVGERIAGLVGPGGDHRGCDANTTVGCGPMSSYPALRGTTRLDEYDILNGWAASSFAYNLEDDE